MLLSSAILHANLCTSEKTGIESHINSCFRPSTGESAGREVHIRMLSGLAITAMLQRPTTKTNPMVPRAASTAETEFR